MAENKKTKTIAEALMERKITFGSKEHVALVEGAYGMTVEKANTIVKERPANPQLYPYDLFEKAQAMLEALKTKPITIDTDPGWTREQA